MRGIRQDIPQILLIPLQRRDTGSHLDAVARWKYQRENPGAARASQSPQVMLVVYPQRCADVSLTHGPVAHLVEHGRYLVVAGIARNGCNTQPCHCGVAAQLGTHLC